MSKLIAPTHFGLEKDGRLESEEAFLMETYSAMELSGEESHLVQKSKDSQEVSQHQPMVCCVLRSICTIVQPHFFLHFTTSENNQTFQSSLNEADDIAEDNLG